jgi:hypothetical protein
MKWDIDRELRRLEPETAAGTTINRVLMDVASMKRNGVEPTAEHLANGCGTIWVVGLGFIQEPKAFFYAQTIRKAFLKARQAYKASRLAEHTPWGTQPFRPKPRRRGSRDRRPAATAAPA